MIVFADVLGKMTGQLLVGGLAMLRTITVGSCVSIQGLLVKQLADGKMVVRVDDKTFVGYPVTSERKAA